MELRARLLALLVAVLCAVGWVRTERPCGPDDGLAARDDVGLLPARRQQASALAVDVDDDEPAWWSSFVERGASYSGTPTLAAPPRSDDTLAAVDRSPVRQRGPPSIA